MKKYLSLALLMSAMVLSTAFNVRALDEEMSHPDDRISMLPGDVGQYPAMRMRLKLASRVAEHRRQLRGKAGWASLRERLAGLKERLQEATPQQRRQIRRQIAQLNARMDSHNDSSQRHSERHHRRHGAEGFGMGHSRSGY